MMNGANKVELCSFGFAFLALFSLLFFPEIKLNNSLPTLQTIDFLLPVFAVLIFLQKDKFKWLKYYNWILGYALIILISILANGRYKSYIDYFEIYKILKFLLILSFFSLQNLERFLKAVKLVFVLLVGVNLLHFYNVFNINYLLEHYYGGGVHIQYFGLNSIGEPATKRMVGTMGNPNVNAILFGFFALGFIPLQYQKKSMPWFFTALLMMFLCQSRTVILAMVVSMFWIFALRMSDWKLKHWGLIALMFSAYFLSWAMASNFFISSLYSNSIFDTNLMETQSALGRMEVWQHLWGMAIQNPIIGHGPFKEYFYENQIYPENEYILIFWRYGLLGLLMFLAIFAVPVIWFLQNMNKSNINKYGLLFINLMLVSGLTNAPFTNRNVRIIFAITLGLIISEIYHSKSKTT